MIKHTGSVIICTKSYKSFALYSTSSVDDEKRQHQFVKYIIPDKLRLNAD